jgi:AraC-like DNA-binding protein
MQSGSSNAVSFFNPAVNEVNPVARPADALTMALHGLVAGKGLTSSASFVKKNGQSVLRWSAEGKPGTKSWACMGIGLFDIVEFLNERTGATKRVQIVTSLRQDALRGFIEWVLTEELGGTLPIESFSPFKRDPVLQREYSEFSRITNKILLLIHSEYATSLSLTTIAAQFDMSSKYIGRIFLKDTGLRFTEYLMAYRMLEAKHRIISTNEKISVIAGLVGYSQLNNFYIHFRNYFGVSPSSMRSFDSMTELENAYL